MWGMRQRMGGSRRVRRGCDQAASPDPQRTEDMIAFVEQQLGITAAQREAWDRFTETVRDSADAMQIARGAVDDGEPGALQRFARFEVVADAASAALRRIRPALESLYRTLDEAQRKAFDELLSHGSPHAYGARN